MITTTAIRVPRSYAALCGRPAVLTMTMGAWTTDHELDLTGWVSKLGGDGRAVVWGSPSADYVLVELT